MPRGARLLYNAAMKISIVKFFFAAAGIFMFMAGTAFAGEAGRVTAAELKELLSKGGVVLIDVRTPEEHSEMHIPGSVLMPLSTLNEAEKLPGGKRVVIYCRSGKRSLQAIKILSEKGFTGLTDLAGGIIAWKDSGGEVVSGSR